jgi:hypothetical protein
MLDHDAAREALIARVFDGQSEGLTRDDILENITLYWLTNTAVSSARLYWESKLSFFAPKGVAIPVAVSAFPDEIYTAPKSWAGEAYPKLTTGFPRAGTLRRGSSRRSSLRSFGRHSNRYANDDFALGFYERAKSKTSYSLLVTLSQCSGAKDRKRNWRSV